MRESYSCLCSTTLSGQRKAIQKFVCIMLKKWQRLRPNSSQDTGASWGPRQKIRDGTKNPTNLQDSWILSHYWWLTYSSVTLPTRSFQRQNRHRLDSDGEDEEMTVSNAPSTTKSFSSKPFWQAIYFAFTIESANDM